MPDPWLPLEDRLAFWDPLGEQVRVLGWRPGPAGVSSIELVPGLRASVDHAGPSTLTELTIDTDAGQIGGEALSVVAQLLGDEAAELVRRLPASSRSDRPTTLRTRSTRDRSTRPRVDDLPGTELWLPQLVLTGDLADDAALSDLARAAALLDGVQPAATLGLPLARDLARRGVELLLSAPLVPLYPDHRANLERRLSLVERLTPGAVTDLDLHRARRRLDGAGTYRAADRRAAAGMAPSALPAAAKAAAPMVADFAGSRAAVDDIRERPGAPLPVEGDHRSWAWLERGSNVVFQASGSAAGAWGRVHRAADRLLLGLAPLRAAEDADGLRALVVIPPAADPRSLTVDVVDDPTTPRRAPAHDHTRRAVLAGRRAARLTRLGDPAADAAWQDCAHLWSALGDTQRSNLALRHGRRDATRTVPTPLLVDELRG